MKSAPFFTAFIAVSLHAQNSQHLEFDVADIRLNTSTGEAGSGPVQPGGKLRAVNMPVRELIKFAYGVRDEALIGVPAWVDTDHYDVSAKGPAVGSEENLLEVHQCRRYHASGL